MEKGDYEFVLFEAVGIPEYCLRKFAELKLGVTLQLAVLCTLFDNICELNGIDKIEALDKYIKPSLIKVNEEMGPAFKKFQEVADETENA